jgi:hypothetical protein
MICPLRKGGLCVKYECAWFNRGICAILSIAVSLNKLIDNESVNRIKQPSLNVFSDDDVPF